MSRRPPRDKQPTPQEIRDWADEVAEVAAYGETVEAPEPVEGEPQPPAPPSLSRTSLRRKSPEPLPARLEPLEVGNFRGVDKRTAERIRKGNQPIEAALDLHGMYQEQAAQAFYEFIQRQQQEGARCVLVITGQGLRSGRGPVLQQAVQRWVNEPLLRPHIVAIDYATRQQGGKGAYSIYLRRTRIYE